MKKGTYTQGRDASSFPACLGLFLAREGFQGIACHGLAKEQNNKEENKNNFSEFISKDITDFYDTHDGFVKEKQYLEKEFFTSMVYLLNKMYINGEANNKFDVLLDDTISGSSKGKTDVSINRLSVILRNASNYIIKYDPTNMPSVIKNAEGKSIYRYVKYTP